MKYYNSIHESHFKCSYIFLGDDNLINAKLYSVCWIRVSFKKSVDIELVSFNNSSNK